MRNFNSVMTGLVSFALATCTFGCADDSSTSTATATGNSALSVLLEPEGTITDGIEAGDEVDKIRDGWTVEFSRYIVAVGDVDLALSTDQTATAEATDASLEKT